MTVSPPDVSHILTYPYYEVKNYIDHFPTIDKLDHIPITLPNGNTSTFDHQFKSFEVAIMKLGHGTRVANSDKLNFLKERTPILYAYLIYIIHNFLIKNPLTLPAYQPRAITKPPPDDNLRNYYETAKTLFKGLTLTTNEQDLIRYVTREVIAAMTGADVTPKLTNERNRAVLLNDRYVNRYRYNVITQLITSFETNGIRGADVDFDVQNFGGSGDCLFLTLLAEIFL